MLEVGQAVSSEKYWRPGGVAASGFGKAVGAQEPPGTHPPHHHHDAQGEGHLHQRGGEWGAQERGKVVG